MENFYPFEELKKINIPTLIVHGDADTHVPYDDSKNYVRNLKNGKLITIKSSEHGFHDSEKDSHKANQETLKFFLKYL